MTSDSTEKTECPDRNPAQLDLPLMPWSGWERFNRRAMALEFGQSADRFRHLFLNLIPANPGNGGGGPSTANGSR